MKARLGGPLSPVLFSGDTHLLPGAVGTLELWLLGVEM